MANQTLEHPIAASQIALRLRTVSRAAAQQELEGLTVSPAILEDMHRAARGEISEDDVIANTYARFDHVPIL